MDATVKLILAVIGLGGLGLFINEILGIINRGRTASKNADVLDLTKRIQDQKIIIQGKEKTAQELLGAYRREAEKFNEFDSNDDPNKPAS